MRVFLDKDKELRNDCVQILEKSHSCSTPMSILVGAAKLIAGFLGSWLGIIVLVKIISMVIRALSQ